MVRNKMFDVFNDYKRGDKKAFFFLILFLFLSAQLFPQQNSLNSLRKTFNTYGIENLQEKIFVHTDKDSYLAGEIIWFKIYNVHGSSNSPLDLSKVAYIEILNKDQKPILQTKVSLNKGTGTGSLYLPLSTLTEGYRLRAYTAWMKNTSADYYFEKPVTIINTLKELAPPSHHAPAYDIQFFPEGGNLVAGIQSRVAFRATDNKGKGITFDGALINQDNDIVVSFQPTKFGIGTFSFTPRRGDVYRVKFSPRGAKPILKEFVPVHTSGYVMELKQTEGEKLQLRIETNREDDSLFLFVHTRQQLKIAETISIRKGKATIEIDKNRFGEGISHFTIFNSFFQPVCERLYFHRPERRLVIEAKTDQNMYGSRKRVSLSISTRDEKNRTLPASMSVSVFRTDSLATVIGSDIESYLWLSSDLRGKVESPAYYFKNDDAAAYEAIDNLMLTHGWRRFKWEGILQEKKSSVKYIPEYEGHIVKGKVSDIRTGAPLKDVLTYLSIPGKRAQLYGSRSDEFGQIRFFTKNFYGSAEMIIQPDYRIDSTARIEISNPYSDSYASNLYPEFNLSPANYKFVNSQSIAMQVQNIYSSNKLRQEYFPSVDTSAFYGSSGKKYLLDNYTRFTTMEEVLREYVPEIDVSLRKKSFFLRAVNEPYKKYFDLEPLILLDGVPVFDGNKFMLHDPMKIQSLEVITKQYYLGPLVFPGIASFTTYKGNLDGLNLDPRSAVIDYEGLQLYREFYSPVYDSNNSTSRIPDFRNVLYWSGKLQSDAAGKELRSFFTSDQTGNYTVVVQGITEEGRSGSTILNFDVVETPMNVKN